ncbi:MAG: TonB-dependent receptor [Thermoanaerobaculales bacterium]|jgi:iron complex outermembrane receptor protein|nr:TonB-dependent receptor [Thermoanaerobaculales bacterium]
MTGLFSQIRSATVVVLPSTAMGRLLLRLVLCGALLSAGAASALDLRVVGLDGRALAGARVMVIGSAGSWVADNDGRLTISPDPEPPVILFIARPDGVALKPVTIGELPEDGFFEVEVEAAGETVTVISGIVPDLELPPATAATVLGRSDLEQRAPTSLVQAIENLPGAGGSGTGHAAVPSLRGLPKHRTLIILDGGRVTTERRAGPSASFLDPASVEEVEVVRGPGSVAYGSDAFGGIIRARSRTPDPQAGPELRYSLLGGVGLPEAGATAEVSAPALGGAFLLGGQWRRQDDYDSPEGEVPNSEAELGGFRAGYRANLGSGVLRVGWRTDLGRDIGKPAPDSQVERVFYSRDDSHRFDLGFEGPGPGSWNRLAATLFWDDYRLVLDKDRFATDDELRQLRVGDTSANDIGLRVEAERPLGPARLVLGADLSGRMNLHAVNSTTFYDAAGGVVDSSSEVSIDDARRHDIGLFAAANRDWARWGIAAGLRVDAIRTENQGGYFGDVTTSNTDVSGFLALTRDLGAGVEATLQIARGFRDPLLSDRYYRGITGRGFITGNPDLEPETSRQVDLAVHWRRDRLSLAGYAYAYRIDDLIERYRTDTGYFFRNRGAGEITGVEVEAGWVLDSGVELNLGAWWLRGEVVDDGSPTDDVPAPGVSAVIRGTPADRWWWMLRGAVYLEDDRPGPSEQAVPGYAVLDAGVGLRLSDALELNLLGRNLFDKAYLDSSDEDAVLAPGRSFQLSIRGRFGG